MEPPRNLRKQVIQPGHPGGQVIISHHKIDTLHSVHYKVRLEY